MKKRIALAVLVLWLCLKIAGVYLGLRGPWGPQVGGTLPNGHVVYFQARAVGKETDDRLTWIDAAGSRKDFWVDQIHGGFLHVVLKHDASGNHVWVESGSKVGASIDLESGDFRPELAPQFPWARFGEGQVLDEGRTWSVLGILAPW